MRQVRQRLLLLDPDDAGVGEAEDGLVPWNDEARAVGDRAGGFDDVADVHYRKSPVTSLKRPAATAASMLQ